MYVVTPHLHYPWIVKRQRGNETQWHCSHCHRKDTSYDASDSELESTGKHFIALHEGCISPLPGKGDSQYGEAETEQTGTIYGPNEYNTD